MEKSEIIKFLKTPTNVELDYEVELCLMNDYLFYKKSFLPCVEYAKRRKARKDYDSILMIRYVESAITIFLRNNKIFRRDCFLTSDIPVATRFKVASSMVKYMESDYLK